MKKLKLNKTVAAEKKTNKQTNNNNKTAKNSTELSGDNKLLALKLFVS